MDAIIFLRKRFSRNRGQTMVEFALALPIILMLLFGTLEMGRLLFFYSSVFTASREGARYGAAAGYIGASTTRRYADCTGIRSAAKKLGVYAGVTDGTIQIKYDKGPGDPRSWGALPSCPAEPKLGERVVVRVSTQYTTLVPLLELGPIEISSTTARTILKDVEVGGKAPTPLPTFTLAAGTATPTATATTVGGGGGGPTVTPTTTATPTVTPTPSVDCNDLEVVAGPVYSNFSLSFDIRNNTGKDADVTGLNLTWSSGEILQSVMIGISTVWSGSKSSVASGFALTGDTSLADTSTKSFIFNYDKNIKSTVIKTRVTFDNGCVVVR